MKAKAACTRHLIPLLPHLLPKSWQAGTCHQRTVCFLIEALAEAYACVANDDLSALPACSRKVANLYCSLEAEAEAQGSQAWRVKPMLHLFQALCEHSKQNPKDFWCYREEGFLGEASDIFERRGGWDTPHANSERMLLKWMLDNPLPGHQERKRKR